MARQYTTPYRRLSKASSQPRDDLPTPAAATSTVGSSGCRRLTLELLPFLAMILFFSTICSIGNYVPAVPAVNVSATARAITRLSPASAQVFSLRIALLVSNEYYAHTLSFHNVTVSLGGGGGLIPHPPFQVSGRGTSVIRFRLGNATLPVDSYGLASLRVDLAAVGLTRWKVWLGISKEGWVRARCGPVTVSLSLNEEIDDDDDDTTFVKTEAGGCESSGLWEWKQGGIMWGAFLGFAICVSVIYVCLWCSSSTNCC